MKARLVPSFLLVIPAIVAVNALFYYVVRDEFQRLLLSAVARIAESARLAAEASAAAGEQAPLLFFRAGGSRFALDVAYVRVILPPLAVTPVPLPVVAALV